MTAQNEISDEALAEAIRKDDELRAEVRAELRAQPLRLIGMYVMDFLSVLSRTALETMIVIAAFFVWGWLCASRDTLGQLHQAPEGAVRTMANFFFFVTFCLALMLRVMMGAFSRTYWSTYSALYEKRRSHARTVAVVEAVLKRHGLLEQDAAASVQ
ncbi:hypothetical protein AB4Y45_32995 [Paraburkholderia sp. EG287A]|uniref:hypothetical protein n=1 Tax=Paraburkholderia sp. EG287A TaxID=3237012 RepID=UPI0034D37C2C